MTNDGRPLTGQERMKFVLDVSKENEKRAEARDPLDFEDPQDIYDDAVWVIEEKLVEAKAEVERLLLVQRALRDAHRLGQSEGYKSAVNGIAEG